MNNLLDYLKIQLEKKSKPYTYWQSLKTIVDLNKTLIEQNNAKLTKSFATRT